MLVKSSVLLQSSQVKIHPSMITTKERCHEQPGQEILKILIMVATPGGTRLLLKILIHTQVRRPICLTQADTKSTILTVSQAKTDKHW